MEKFAEILSYIVHIIYGFVTFVRTAAKLLFRKRAHHYDVKSNSDENTSNESDFTKKGE